MTPDNQETKSQMATDKEDDLLYPVINTDDEGDDGDKVKDGWRRLPPHHPHPQTPTLPLTPLQDPDLPQFERISIDVNSART